MSSVVGLCMELEIVFRLDTVDCEPFYHGYSKICSEAQHTTGIWNFPITNINGRSAFIPFYVTPGDGFLLLGKEKLRQSYQIGPDNLIHIPGGVRNLSTVELTLETFYEDTNLEDPDSGRNYLLVIPAKLPYLQ